MDRLQRSELLTREARRITERLVGRGATLVLVFGSFAMGKVRRTSDLDMIAVMESDLSFIRRLEELYRAVAPKVGLDMLVYTPEEWEEIRERSFIRRALEEGPVLPGRQPARARDGSRAARSALVARGAPVYRYGSPGSGPGRTTTAFVTRR